MVRKPQISTASLNGGIIIALLGTTALVVSIQGTEFKEDLKNGSRPATRGNLSAVYRSVRYSTSVHGAGNNIEEKLQPSTTVSAVGDSNREQVTQKVGISESKKHKTAFSTRNRTSLLETSLHTVNKPLVFSPIIRLLKQENINSAFVLPSSRFREETQTESVLLSSTSSVSPQWNHYDGTTESTKETDKVTDTYMTAQTERMRLVASSEVQHVANKRSDLDTQATVSHSRFVTESDSMFKESQTAAVLENEEELLGMPSNAAENIELYAVPKEATGIIALNSQLLGYNEGRHDNLAHWHSPKYHPTTLRYEQDITTVEDATEIPSTPPADTATHKRTSRRRRRRRKGQKSEYSRKEAQQTIGEDIHLQTLPNTASVETIEHEYTTLSPARNRYGMRKEKYTGQSRRENYGRETLAASESAYDEPNTTEQRNIEGKTPVTSQSTHDGPNADIEKANEGARYQPYRKRRPRYRVKVRRRNNHTLINDEDGIRESGHSNEVSMILNNKEGTQKTLESTERYPATTLRTHIIHAINDLQEMNTFIVSRKDEMNSKTKNDSLPQPLILLSRPLIRNFLGANASQYQRLDVSEQEFPEVLHALPHHLHAELLPPQESFSEPTQNLRRFRNFTKRYEEDFPAAAPTIRRNVSSVQQGRRQPKLYASSDTQREVLPPVDLLGGIPVQAVIEKDLVTSEQQRKYPTGLENIVLNICKNRTIPEIIECIRNFYQRKTSERKGSYTEVRNSALRSLPERVQFKDVKSQRSSRNSTTASAQLYSKPTEQGISVNSATKYNENLAPNRIRKTVSSTPKRGLTSVHSGTGGKPHPTTSINNDKASNIATSLSAALKVGGRLLLSQLQKLKNVVLQIPAQLGRLSVEYGNQKQAQKLKSSYPSNSAFSSRSSSSSSFSWR